MTDLAIVVVPSKEGGWIAMEPELKLAGTGATVYEATCALYVLMEEHSAPQDLRARLAAGLRLTPVKKAANAPHVARPARRESHLRLVR